MTDRELMQMAFEVAAIYREHDPKGQGVADQLYKVLAEHLSKPDSKTKWQKVVQKDEHGNEISWFKPKGEWVGLTDEDMTELDEDGVTFARYIEAKLKEKNT